MPVIDEIREQHAIVKQKGLKYKLLYFKDYYLVPTICTIIGIIVVIYFVRSIVTAKMPVFQALMINGSAAPDAAAFGEIIGINPEKEEVVFDFNYYLNPDPENVDNVTYTNSQKIMAVIAAKTADVMVAPQSIITRYLDGGVFTDIRDYFTDAELIAMGDAIIWYSTTDEETGEVAEPLPLAIDVTKAPGLEGCYITDEPLWMGVLINTQHPEDISKYYHFITE